ncbi:hypothetical protein ACIBG0_04780 [Nocardia sp. NPDC050630]|uniref:hypothetical protein n=1 Tax=Nocardia sp. NPDC050630 TaxID=3364321 RepID=UPI00379B48A2
MFTIGCEPTALAIGAVAPVVTFALNVSWFASTARHATWEVTRLHVDSRRDEAWFGWVFRGLTALPVAWN